MANKITRLVLKEISSVDNPAQPHATMSIMKRHDPLVETIKKYYGDSIATNRETIKDFSQLLNMRDKENKLWKAREELWPVMDAFRETVNNIVVDTNLSLDAKMAQIESNVNSFVAAVRDKVPDVEEELTKFFKDAGLSGTTQTDNQEKPVSDLEKKVEELTKALDTAKAEAEVAKSVSALNDAEKAHYNTLDDAGKTSFLAKSADDRKVLVEKVAKADETVELDGTVIRKSEVGAGTFAVLKSQAEAIKKANERIAKAEEAAEMADLRKRADDEFPKVLGTTEERAALLKFLNGAPEAVKTHALNVLKSANESAGFKTIGKSTTEHVDVQKKFTEKVAEIRKRDNVNETQAMATVAIEFPELVPTQE